MIEKLSWWDGKYENQATISRSNLSTTDTLQFVDDGRMRFKRLKNLEAESRGGKPIVSIGVHKMWAHFTSVHRDHFMSECPYLKDTWP